MKGLYDNGEYMYISTTTQCYAMPCKNAHANASLCKRCSYAVAMLTFDIVNGLMPEHQHISNDEPMPP